MEHAESLAERRHFHATEVNAPTDEELKELVKKLMLVCPACHTAVHKCGSAFTKRQYFSHYHIPNAKCEFRVRTIIREAASSPMVVTRPRGQELEELLRRLPEILIEHAGDEQAPYWQGAIDLIQRRPFFRKTVHVLRDTLRALARDVAERSPLVDEHVRNVVHYITATNAFKLMMFSICYGMFLTRMMDDDSHNDWLNDGLDNFKAKYGIPASKEEIKELAEEDRRIKKLLIFANNRDLRDSIVEKRLSVKDAATTMGLAIMHTAIMFNMVITSEKSEKVIKITKT